MWVTSRQRSFGGGGGGSKRKGGRRRRLKTSWLNDTSAKFRHRSSAKKMRKSLAYFLFISLANRKASFFFFFIPNAFFFPFSNIDKRLFFLLLFLIFWKVIFSFPWRKLFSPLNSPGKLNEIRFFFSPHRKQKKECGETRFSDFNARETHATPGGGKGMQEFPSDK